METIKKIISLEDYKCRFNNKTPYIDKNGNITQVTENNWGEIPCDYCFKTLEECSFAKIKDNLPLVSGIDMSSNSEKIMFNTYCFRYKTMVYWHNWIINYGKKSKYYKLCKRETNYIWRELNNSIENGDFFKNDYNLGVEAVNSVNYIPINYGDYKIGDIIEVNSDADMFRRTFRVNDDNTRYELLVLNFIKDYFNDKNISDNLSLPYIDIPLHLTQTIDNLGVLSSTAKQWDPRKTYALDDIVIYNKNTYILKNGDSYELVELTGGIYETFIDYIKNGNSLFYNFINGVEINSESTPIEVVYDNESGRKNIYYTTNEGYYRIFLPYICHKAKMNDTNGEFIFDKDLWVLNTGNYDTIAKDESGIIIEGGLSGETYQNSFIRTSSDSQLTTLRRTKKSVDEDGNVLPFILDNYKSMDTEIPYNVGIHNIYMGPNEIFRGDIMENIIINNEDNSQYLLVNYVGEGKTYIFTKFHKKIEENIDKNIIIHNNITLTNIESGNTILYSWEEKNKTTEKDDNIELIDILPNPEEKYLGKNFQTTSYTDSILYYTTYECIESKISVEYSGITSNNVYITPSMLLLGNRELTSTKGSIIFSYIKDCFLIYNDEDDTLKNIDYETGLNYNESYQYEINVAGVNLVHNKIIETHTTHNYNLYDYELESNDEITGTINDVDINDYHNVGNIYSVVDNNGNIVGYKRLLSEYNFIDIDFENSMYEVVSTDIENLKKNTILSTIDYTLDSITKDDFQKDYVIKNEYTIGLEDVIEDIDISIERGTSSSFEKHHILCEIKSFSDLENYRNNLFNL